MATKFAQKSRGDAQLEYRENHLADVVAENLEQHLIDLRRLAFATHEITEHALDRTKGRFDVTTLKRGKA